MNQVYFWVGFAVMQAVWVIPASIIAALLINGVFVTVSKIIFFSFLVTRFPDTRSNKFSWRYLIKDICNGFLMNCFITDEEEISLPGKGLWKGWKSFRVEKPRKDV